MARRGSSVVVGTLRGGARIYVDDYADRVWVHINQPYTGWILYSTVCQ